MAEQFKKLHPMKYFRDYLNQNIRPDGREFLKYRPIIINVNSIKTAEGSAIAKLGDTCIVCGIKAELSTPKPEEPDRGFLIPDVVLSPMCSPKYKPGPPSDEAQVASQTVCDIVANSQCIDLQQLCISYDKLCWVLYCDMVCLNDDGCIVDACVLALCAALKTVLLPTVEYDVDTGSTVVLEDKKKLLTLGTMPTAHTFSLFDDKWLLADPTEEEESLSTTVITVVMSGDELSLIHKPGGSPASEEVIEICTAEAKKRAPIIGNAADKAIQSANLL